MNFFLPKGAYATNLLREIAHREIIEETKEELESCENEILFGD